MADGIQKVFVGDAVSRVDFAATPTRSIAPSDVVFSAVVGSTGIQKVLKSESGNGIQKIFQGD